MEGTDQEVKVTRGTLQIQDADDDLYVISLREAACMMTLLLYMPATRFCRLPLK